MRGPVVELHGNPENIDDLRRELERKGYDVVVIPKEIRGVLGKYHTETMKNPEEIRSLLLGIVS